jgi:hypothetical protein
MRWLSIPGLLLLTACAGAPTAPGCSESAYRSLNPAHYPLGKDSTRDDDRFLTPKS